MGSINNSSKWVSEPISKPKDLSALSLDEMMKILAEKAMKEQSTALGEINGMYAAYKISPSVELLESILAKALLLLINGSEKMQVFVDNASNPSNEPVPMKEEWVDGFKYYLSCCGIKEKTIEVYVRAIKRVMRQELKDGDVTSFIEELDRIIDKYDGKDAKSHNIHISSLRRFKSFVQDKNGYIVAIEHNGQIEVASRIYCSIETAEEEYEQIKEEYSGRNDTVRIALYDKFGRLIKY